MMHKICSGAPASTKGVTLIELMVVLALVLIMVALSIAYVVVNRVSGAARTIYYDLQYARIQAIAKRHDFRVLFNTSGACHTFDGHTYKIHGNSNGDGTCDACEYIQTKDVNQDFKGVVFFDTAPNITFNPIGTCNQGTITLNDGKRTRKVIILRTGRIRIE